MIRIWRGFHSTELQKLIQSTWTSEDLLVLCPPGLKDFSFVDLLPEGAIESCGSWDDAPALPPTNGASGAPAYPEKPVLGVFTSGTAGGIPRLVLYSKRGLLASLEGIRSFFDTSRFDTLFCYPQPFHTFGLTLGYLHSVVYGLKLVTGEGRYSRSFHEKRLALREASVLTLGTPTHFFDLLSYVRAERADLHPSYSCIIGGAKVSVPLWQAIRDNFKIAAPSIGYGATEASPGVTHQAPGLAPREEGEIGTPLPGVSLAIREGGLEFTGPNVCLAIIQGGELRFPKSIILNDQIRRRPDGIHVYEGRTDLVLNRGAQKFSLEKIEEAIRTRMDVEALCVSVPDERLGEELGVVVREPEGSEALQARIFELLHQEFGQSFNPAHFITIEQFPLNESSKVDRRQGARLFQGI